MLYSDDWHFEDPAESGVYFCIVLYGCTLRHEVLNFFVDGSTDVDQDDLKDKKNFWAELDTDIWSWFTVGKDYSLDNITKDGIYRGVVAWQPLTYPTKFKGMNIEGGVIV